MIGKSNLVLIQVVIALGASGLATAEALEGAEQAAATIEVPGSSGRVETPGNFGGFYVGVDAGSQNVFGGAFIDGVDVLTQDTRTVVDLSLGWSKEFDNRLMFGIELRYGLLNGDLELTTRSSEPAIRYDNDSQAGYRLAMGRVLGRRRTALVYLYLGETQRNFDILIETPEVSFTQSDRQGGERFGLGIEKRFAGKWSARATAGTLNTDFGDLVTSTEIDEDVAVAVGLTYRFRGSRQS